MLVYPLVEARGMMVLKKNMCDTEKDKTGRKRRMRPEYMSYYVRVSQIP